MSEEEKAIERCKELIKPEHSNWIGITNQKAIGTVLNLIEKQQTEIQNLTKRANELVNENENEHLEKNNYIFRLENEIEALHKVIDKEFE